MLIATLLAAAAQGTNPTEAAEAVEKAQPLIDIDGTAFIQFQQRRRGLCVLSRTGMCRRDRRIGKDMRVLSRNATGADSARGFDRWDQHY